MHGVTSREIRKTQGSSRVRCPHLEWTENKALRQKLIDLLLTPAEEAESIERICGELGDWRDFFDLARREGLLGIVADRIMPHAPAGERRPLAQTVAMQNLAALRQTLNLREVLSALEARRIPCVALKGLLLAERLYPRPSARVCVDIDLLIPPADLPAAAAALSDIGYHKARPTFDDLATPARHHLCLVRPRSAAVELHHRVTAVLGSVIEAGPFLSRSIPYRSASGISTRVLEPEDEFLQLAVRTVADRFALLRLYDLKLFMQRHRDLRWETISSRARETGFNTPVFLAAWALDKIMLEPGPAAGLDVRPNPLAARHAERVVSGLSASTRSSPRRHSPRYLACKGIACDRPLTGAGVYVLDWLGLPWRYVHLRLADRRLP